MAVAEFPRDPSDEGDINLDEQKRTNEHLQREIDILTRSYALKHPQNSQNLKSDTVPGTYEVNINDKNSENIN